MDKLDWLSGGSRTPPTAAAGASAPQSDPAATSGTSARAAGLVRPGGEGAVAGPESSGSRVVQQPATYSAPVDDWLHLSTIMLETLDDDPSTPSDAMLDEAALERLMRSGGGDQASASSSSSSHVPFHQMSVSDMAIATQQAILASSLYSSGVRGPMGSHPLLDFPGIDNSHLGLGMGMRSGLSPTPGMNFRRVNGVPGLSPLGSMGLRINSPKPSFQSPASHGLASFTPPPKHRQSAGSSSSAAAAASASASSSASSSAPVKVKTEQEIDKRKRNTEASARFRAKKKMKQQMLEMSTKELSERVELLERRLQEYSMEIIMLRQELACDASRQRKSLRDIYAENNVEYHPENLTAAGQGMLERGLIGIGAISNTSSTFELGLGPNQSDDGYAASDSFPDMMVEQGSGDHTEARLDAIALNSAAAAAAAASENARSSSLSTEYLLNEPRSSGSDNGSMRQKRK